MDIGFRAFCVIGVIEEMTGLKGVGVDSDLAAMGCDSFDMIELVMAIEEAFDVVITDTECESIATAQDIINLVAAKCVGAANGVVYAHYH